MSRPKGLGKGLAALIPERTPPVGGAPEVRTLAVADISPNPYQPRQDFKPEAMQELVESVRRHGILQPLLVRPRPQGFELVAGERRLRAAREVGLATVPAYVREVDDREVMEMALVENLQRSDLNPIEEAQAFWRLIQEFGWTQEDVAARVGRSRPQVANYLRLLGLEAAIQDRVRDGSLTVAHAKVLLSVEEADRRRALAEQAVEQAWTVKQLEAAAARREIPAKMRPEPDTHLKRIEGELRRRFGTKVALRGSASKGRIEIPYRTLEELERILALLEPAPLGDDGFVV